jgi:hypothetical protein
MNINDITIVMPTSVLPSHPDTGILDEVIRSIRQYFPDNEIVLQVDGLREEQSHRKEQYDEYKSRVLWKCLHEYKNVLPIMFDEHSHQSTMMQQSLHLITTPLMFYIESDIALRDNLNLDWQKALDMLDSKTAYTIRFYTFETQVVPAHEPLMMDRDGDFVQTFQWSQQPHITYVSYYRDMVLPNTNYKSFIEDTFYGKVFSDCYETKEAWNNHRLWLYNPLNKDDIRIVNNLDGRKHLRKFTSDDEAWGLTEA